MILTDGINTFTSIEEDIEEETILNGSTLVTVGGSPKSQADSIRYRILSKVRVKNSDSLDNDLIKLRSILDNFGARKYYTPQRVLAGSTAINQIEVIIKSHKINLRGYSDQYTLYYDVEMEQVI